VSVADLTQEQLHANQRAQILALLHDHSRTNIELNELCLRYGGRIYELRQEGWPIVTARLSTTLYRYTLTGPKGAPLPPVRRRYLFIPDAFGVGTGEVEVEGPFDDEPARQARVEALLVHGFGAEELFLLDLRYKHRPSIWRVWP
jgi:hypothetical protein